MRLADVVSEEYGWIVAQSMRLCRNEADAEDLAGDVVLKILSQGKYDPGRPFRPWCSVIILNTYITMFNRRGLVSFTDVEDTLPVPSCSDSTSCAVMSEILSAIRRCRRRSQTVDCVLMYASGYSYDEISEYFRIPPGTVRSRINYARKMIRKELGNQYVK